MKNYLLITGLLTTTTLTLFSCGEPKKDPLEEMELDRKVEAYMDSLNTAALIEEQAWQYETTEDEMSGKTNRFATKTSNNTVELDFPYEGGTVGNIIVRNTGNGDEVVFTVNKGQINSVYDYDSFEVRFDDNPSEEYSVSESTDGSSDIRFISNSKKFIKNLKASKECKIKVEFYDNGSFIFKFDTKGLKWE
jgi:hypothetical protein